MRSSTRAWRRWRSSRSASWRPGPPRAVLVRNPVTRRPSASVIRSCAPGCGRSLRRISRVPVGQADRSTSAGGLGDPGAVAGFDLHAGLGGAGLAGLVGRGPRRFGQGRERGVDVEVAQAAPRRRTPPRAGRRWRGELLGGAGGVGAHQHRHPARGRRGRAAAAGIWASAASSTTHVVGGGVRAGLARAQQLGHRLPAAAGAVIDEPEQRVEPESLLPGPGRVLLVRVRGDQGGVQVDHHPPVLDRRPGPPPHPLPGRRPRRADRRQRGVGIRGQSRRSAATPSGPRPPARTPRAGRATPRCRRRRPRPARPRPPDPPRSSPGRASPAARRHGPSSRDSSSARPLRRAVSTNNTPPACDTSDSPPAITDNQGRKSLCFTRGVPLSSVRSWSRQPRSNRAEQALSRIPGPRVATRSTSMKARG